MLLLHEAIGVNFVDTMLRDGTFKVPLPFSMRVEAAGIVEALGPNFPNLKVGDRVGHFSAFGAYAERWVIDANALIKLPDNMSSEKAAGVLSKGLTSSALLKQVHAVWASEAVVVHGASGARFAPLGKVTGRQCNRYRRFGKQGNCCWALVAKGIDPRAHRHLEGNARRLATANA